jgi:hypothetical protein
MAELKQANAQDGMADATGPQSWVVPAIQEVTGPEVVVVIVVIIFVMPVDDEVDVEVTEVVVPVVVAQGVVGLAVTQLHSP